MQIRKMLAAFISFMMIYPVVSVSAFAVDETQIVTDLVSPAYEYAAKTENYLTITSSTADCKSLSNLRRQLHSISTDPSAFQAYALL